MHPKRAGASLPQKTQRASASAGALSLFRRLDRLLLLTLLRGFDQSSRLIELHRQSDPRQLKREKCIAGFRCGCESCKLCTTLRVLTTLFGGPASLPLSKRCLSPSPTKIIDSKERVFCQCGSRELQQEARAERLRVGNFFALAVPMRKPAAELHANRVSPSAEVSSLNGGCWRWRVTRAAYAVAQISHVRIELA